METDLITTYSGVVHLYNPSTLGWTLSKTIIPDIIDSNALAVGDILVDVIVSPTYTAVSGGIVAVFDISQ